VVVSLSRRQDSIRGGYRAVDGSVNCRGESRCLDSSKPWFLGDDEKGQGAGLRTGGVNVAARVKWIAAEV
jgi:hypothetical protein